jgi:hypothetical protein
MRSFGKISSLGCGKPDSREGEQKSSIAVDYLQALVEVPGSKFIM